MAVWKSDNVGGLVVRLKGEMAWWWEIQDSEMWCRGSFLLTTEDDDACGRRWASGEVFVCGDGVTWCKMLRRFLGFLGGQDLFCWVV